MTGAEPGLNLAALTLALYDTMPQGIESDERRAIADRQAKRVMRLLENALAEQREGIAKAIENVTCPYWSATTRNGGLISGYRQAQDDLSSLARAYQGTATPAQEGAKS